MDDAPRSATKSFGDERARFGPPVVTGVVAVVAIASIVARFMVRSPMWLDEALTVNISKGSLAQIADRLHSDGHPPLYYALLHYWMELFGDGDKVVRALSGIISLAALPLGWAAGRRIGGPRVAMSAVVVLALSPFALRYGSEARMYSLVMVEVLAGFVLVWDALERPTRWRLVGVAVITSAMLWTHYWSFWLLGAVSLVLAAHVVRHRHAVTWLRQPAVATLGAIAVGSVTFLPWMPTLLYQSGHTGTPWAASFRPTTLVYTSLVEFAGGPYSEPQILMLVFVVLIFLGATAVGLDPNRLEVDLRTRPDARPLLIVLIGTVAVASIAGAVTGMAFAARYAAFYFPLAVLLIALGLSRLLAGRARDVTVVVFAVLSLAGLFVVFRAERSQARVVAEAVAAHAGTGLVVTCPDQLGPSTARAIDEQTGTYEVVAYPRLDSPRFVDWVDYAERNARNDPKAVASEVLRRAQGRPLFVVYRDDFLTLRGQCAQLVAQLAAERPSRQLVTGDGDVFYEPMSAIEFGQPGT